jgi:trk system potassium uptake protein TrkH
VAVIHAMSTMATSGITPVDGLAGRPAGIAGEALILVFLVFALSRRTFSGRFDRTWPERMARDREARLAGFAVVVLPTLLFMRHWIGALEVETVANFGNALQALWGSAFTVLSFVTTTGFVSDSWVAAQTWSGLQTPGLLLVGLVLMGGGVATTAGGLKLSGLCALQARRARDGKAHLSPFGRRRGAAGAAHPARGRLYRLDLLHAVHPVAGGRDAGAGGHGAWLSRRR